MWRERPRHGHPLQVLHERGLIWRGSTAPVQIGLGACFHCAKLTSMRGVLISLEGVEGSGKSTQCRLLTAFLADRGHEVVATSEPDGTALGAAVRGLFETDGPAPSALTQTFLFMAARQQHVTQVIRPALARCAVVLSDRYVDATLAYQGFGQGVDLETIRDLNVLATGGAWCRI